MMFDINVAVLTEVEKNTGVTAYQVAISLNENSDCPIKVSREDVSKSLQSLKRKGLVRCSYTTWVSGCKGD